MSEPEIVRIIAFIRPHQLEGVKSAVANVGVTGLSVSDVRGSGRSPIKTAWTGALQGVMALPIRARLEVVVSHELRELVIQAIIDQAYTGESDDGMIFVEPVIDSIRVRTLERGVQAV